MSGSPNSWSAAGKIGKCAAFSNNAANVIYANVHDYDYTTEDFSWAMWLKKDKSTVTATMYAFTVGRADAGGYGYGMQVLNSTQVRFKFGTASYDVSCPDNEWHHFAFTKQGTTICTYVDGVLVGGKRTFSRTYPTYSDGNGIGIGCFHHSGNIYPLTGSVNDFRIYDHTLSPKEVYQLSKGLCLHYKLDDPYQSGMRNLYSGENAAGSNVNGSGSFTRTKLANEPGYNYKLTYTGTGSNSWKSINLPGLSRTNFKPNTKYTWSCKIRINKWTGDTLALRSAISDNDYTNGSVRVADTSKPLGIWMEYSRTITLTEGMHIAATAFYYITEEAYNASTEATKYYVTPRVQFYTGSCPTKDFVYEFDFDLKDLQLIEADEFPGFIDNSVTRGVADESGFGNDGSVTGKLLVYGDSPRNAGCFRSNTSSWVTGGATVHPDRLTLNIWHKGNSLGRLGNWESGGAGIYIKSGKWTGEIYCNGTYAVVTGENASSDTWQMITLTFDGTIEKIYVNGELSATKDCGGYPITYHNTAPWTVNGNPNGSGSVITEPDDSYWSDFRIYATALTADDVKSLYNVGATMDDSGKLYCGELDELGSGASAQKDTVFMSTGVNEPGGCSGYLSSSTLTGYGLPNNSAEYTPVKDTDNSCGPGIGSLTHDPNIHQYRVEYDFEWSGRFDASSTAGTFNFSHRIYMYKIADGAVYWSSPASTPASNAAPLKTWVLGSASGKKHVSYSFTLTDSDLATYKSTSFSFRVNYSNGTGKWKTSNFKVYPERDYKNRVCSINNDGSVSTRELDEALF